MTVMDRLWVRYCSRCGEAVLTALVMNKHETLKCNKCSKRFTHKDKVYAYDLHRRKEREK